MMQDIISILNSTLRLTTPIAFAALGSVIMELSGINALATEGIMLAGAFGAVIGSWLTGSAWVGVFSAMIMSIIVAMIRSYLAIRHQANQTVSGVGLNLLISGFTAMMLKVLWNQDGRSDVVMNLKDWNLAFISDIPILGDLLGVQNPLIYLLFPALLGTWLLIYRTPFGVRIKTAGEHPEVLSSLGLSVARYRYLATILGSALIGLGGAYLSIAQLSFFSRDMTSGRGFMALAATVFGAWSPLGAFAGSLLFGFAEAIQMRLQSIVQYTQFIQMIPYLITIIVLASFGWNRAQGPAASGKPYKEQQ